MELIEDDEQIYAPEYEEIEAEKVKLARKKVKRIKGFYSHLVTFMVINGFLFTINMIVSPFSWWFHWPLLGWGIGLALHGWKTFSTAYLFTKEWEERQIQQILEREGRMR